MKNTTNTTTITNPQFTTLLHAATHGCMDSQHTIWHEICLKQTMSILKGCKEDISIGYITFIEALDKYNPSKLPVGKTHRWQFPAFFNQRLRYAMQTERRTMDYPMKLSSYQVKRKELPLIQDLEGL